LAPVSGVIVSHFDIGSSDVSHLSRDPGWAPFWGSLITGSTHYEILGFSDCEGGVERNTALRWTRAMQVNNALPTAARAAIDRFRAAPLTECVASNATEADRALNRSVVFVPTVTSYTFPPESVTAHACPPHSPAAVTSLADYVSLILCAERQTGFNPRNMLAMLRQLYYGKSWSATSTTSLWDNVIPCSPNLGNPQTRLGSNLFGALWNSAELTADGVDVGHVFTGLEAMVCPAPSVSLYGGLATASLSNEEFATWGGDLGAAVAAHIACGQLGAGAATNEDCGLAPGGRSLRFYYDWHAPTQDLEGDIDAFVMRANLLGVPCGGSAQRTFSPTRPISEVFNEYYSTPTSSLGSAHAHRGRCMLEMLGGTFSGTSLPNRTLVRDLAVPRVVSFANLFYTKIRSLPSDLGDRTRMRLDAPIVMDWFIDYLLSRL